MSEYIVKEGQKVIRNGKPYGEGEVIKMEDHEAADMVRAGSIMKHVKLGAPEQDREPPVHTEQAEPSEKKGKK